MESKRLRSEPKYTFDCIHAIYQVISKYPGNDYGKAEFWMKAGKHPTMPKKLKEINPEVIAEIWWSIKSKISNTQQFKALFRDYDKTNIKGNKYHEEIRANIVDIFFGGKSLDTPLKRKKIIDTEEEMPETNIKDDLNGDSSEEDARSSRQDHEARSEANEDKGENQNLFKETEIGIKEEYASSPKAEMETKSYKEEKGVVENTPPKSETAPSVKEGTPILNEDPFAPDLREPKDLTELITFDRKINADLNRLYKINGKLTTTELAKLDNEQIDFFLDNSVTASSPFIKVYLAVVKGKVPETMLSRSHNVKKMDPIGYLDEEKIRLRELVKETGKSEEEVKKTLFAACGDTHLAKRALCGEDVKLWTPEQDQILTQSKVSKEYIELLKVNGKYCLLNRIQYLKSHSLN